MRKLHPEPILAFFKVERNAAFLLLGFALLGLALANSPLARGFEVFRETELGPANLLGIPLGLNLSLGNWLAEGLVTAFFVLIGLELRREFASGVFQRPSALVIPGLAALFGAALPALVFLWLVSGEAAAGWPVPMATDVTFALAVFAVCGRLMPRSSRVFLLAFAVIDDLIAILVIALFLSGGLNIGSLVLAAICLLVFAWLIRQKHSNAYLILPAILLSATLAWYFTLESGVAPAVMGVALGLCVPAEKLEKLETALHPWVSLVILPLFALFAAAVPLGGAINLLSAMSIAILLRPVAKVMGITTGALIGRKLVRNDPFKGMKPSDYLRISVLGGIGFTVALLITNQVFVPRETLATEATVATLVAMLLSMAAGAWALASRNKRPKG